ncbi:tyrosine-type recombinase/integrase [Paenibacillus ihuae]|uniref:tyrosine-type recombinase/integrase n=1 Tax=Paenibacillus ihuae TaxID=1232431 RepID=UPI0006D59718|nr:tyrosine-type recombinase/integrase [Paenibacillus ihuae]
MPSTSGHYGLAVTVQQAIELSLNLGLRIKETCNIRVEHIVVNKEGRMKVLIPDRVDKSVRSINDVRSGAGTTKGGRFREISIPQSYEKQLSELLKEKSPKDRIITLKEGTLRSALKRACEKGGVQSKGWHGFRHTYARRKLEELLGLNRKEGLEIIKQMLKNQKQHRSIDQGVKDHPLFEFTIKKINEVHSELGHGENRWGLMAVYLSF